MNKGFRAEFNTGYLQLETILHQAKIAGGVDESVHNASVKGYAVGRLVRVTKNADGTYNITKPTSGVGKLVSTSTEDEITNALGQNGGLGDASTGATHIIAQSDNTIRDTIDDYVKDEKYDEIVKNSDEFKTVAVYKIVNPDDIKLVRVYA